MFQKLPRDHWLRLTIVGFITTISLGILLFLPLILGELTEQYDFSKRLIGWFAAINYAGIAFGGLITAFVIQKIGLVRLAQIGLFGLMMCEGLSIFLLDSPLLLALRLVAGIFGGIAYASSLSAFATLDKPVKGYSLYVLVFCLLSAIILPFMPRFLHTYSLVAGFLFLVVLTLFALLSSPLLKVYEQSTSDSSPNYTSSSQLSKLLKNPSIWLVLIAYYALQMSGGVAWSYIELIGEAKMLSENFIAYTLSLGNLFVIPFALAIYWINDKKGLAIPIFGGLAVFMVSMLILYFTFNAWAYSISTIFYLGIWSFIMAFYQSIQAEYDPEGRIIALGAFINMMGQGTGPALAAMFLGNQPYVNVIGLAFVGLVVSFVCISPSVLALERKRLVTGEE